MAKVHPCNDCEQTFTNITDRMIHFVKEHSDTKRLVGLRPSACWRCASEIPHRDIKCRNCGWDKIAGRKIEGDNK